MVKENKAWFAQWFDSEYYHILYKDRSYKEASAFIDTLVEYLQLPLQSSIIDVACGKGRHSIHLNRLGYHVTGVDLSTESIAYANRFSNQNLVFDTHDMRKVYKQEAYDLVVNLFTSFGYFDNETDNFATIKAFADNMKPDGLLVIDFMNIDYVLANLVKEETKEVDGIDFNIKRFVRDGYLIKSIAFEDEDKSYEFEEKVQVLRSVDFEKYFSFAGLQIKTVFGDYELNAFDRLKSPRLIYLLHKQTSN